MACILVGIANAFAVVPAALATGDAFVVDAGSYAVLGRSRAAYTQWTAAVCIACSKAFVVDSDIVFVAFEVAVVFVNACSIQAQFCRMRRREAGRAGLAAGGRAVVGKAFVIADMLTSGTELLAIIVYTLRRAAFRGRALLTQRPAVFGIRIRIAQVVAAVMEVLVALQDAGTADAVRLSVRVALA